MENINDIKLGIIGMNEGNGHPYSWAAIFNGFRSKYMKNCPFPVIPEYLALQNFPEDTIPNATVTHIWTQEISLSKHIANSSKIPYVVDNLEDLIGKIDAVILARDDYENHFFMSKPFIEAGLPIFIDKPLATDLSTAKQILDLEQYSGQIFTCSSLRFAKEFDLNKNQLASFGNLRFIDAVIPKNWEKYAIHIIEPVINLIPHRGKLKSVINTGIENLNIVTVQWENDVTAVFKVLGNLKCPLEINLFGTEKYEKLLFQDTYHAFKKSLESFIETIKNHKISIPREQTLEIVEIIERGFINE